MLPFESNRLLSVLPPGEVEGLKAAAQPKRFPAGSTIFQEGDPGDGLYFILEGAVQISAMVNPEQRRVLARLQEGDFFGEMVVVDNAPRSATAVAEGDLQVCFVPSQVMLDLLLRCPRLAINLVKLFSQRTRDFNRLYIQEVLQAERLTLVGRFARSIVHDFKNPLNIIGISAEMGAMDSATSEMRQTARNRIRKQVDRLSNMINELLEFTRGSQGSVVPATTEYAAYLLPLIEEISAEVAVKNVTLQLVNPPPAVTLLLNPGRLTHVFYNLVHNAVDAMMPDGGRILLRFSTSDTAVITEIEDTGKGIAPEIAGRLFEPFATFGKAQGTGLGLSIARRIIQDHGGQIQARSEPGRGAIFSFTLPRR